MPTRALLAVALGVAALAVLIAADVQSWPISPLVAGMLGSLSGGVLGYLAPSPLTRAPEIVVSPQGPVSPAFVTELAAAFDARDRVTIERDAIPKPAAEATTKRLETDA